MLALICGITGAVSNEEIRLRSLHGHTQFASPGFNERMLASAGLRLLDQVDRTGSLLEVSSRRQAVRLAHRAELEYQEGVRDSIGSNATSKPFAPFHGARLWRG